MLESCFQSVQHRLGPDLWYAIPCRPAILSEVWASEPTVQARLARSGGTLRYVAVSLVTMELASRGSVVSVSSRGDVLPGAWDLVGLLGKLGLGWFPWSFGLCEGYILM